MLFNFPLHLDAVIMRALVDQSGISSLLRGRTPRPNPLPSDVFVPQSPHTDGPAVDFVTIEQRVMDRVEADAPESGAQAVVNQLLAQEWERAFGLYRAEQEMAERIRRNREDTLRACEDQLLANHRQLAISGNAFMFLDSERHLHSFTEPEVLSHTHVAPPVTTAREVALTMEHVRETQRRLLDNNDDWVDWRAFARAYGRNELLRPMTEEPPSLTHRQQLKRDKVGTLLPVSTNASGQVWGKDPHTGKLYHVGQTMACVKNDADDGRPYHDWEGMQHARRFA